ncbi:MAG: TetR family transcriptional regulator C-terminal domain-containing protein, partial [Pseudomonadota bacterium]
LKDQPSALTALRMAFDYVVADARHPGSCGCFIGVTMAQFSSEDEDVTAVIDHYLARARQAIAEALGRAQAAGEITTAASPEELAQLVVYTMQAVSLTGRTSLGGTSQSEAIRAIFRLLEAR